MATCRLHSHFTPPIARSAVLCRSRLQVHAVPALRTAAGARSKRLQGNANFKRLPITSWRSSMRRWSTWHLNDASKHAPTRR
eukprot:11285898-Alexandrium_andersonii.AAC.1